MDVFKANEMESSGQPSKVHISETTYEALSEKDKEGLTFHENFELTDRSGTSLGNMKTYFVFRKVDEKPDDVIRRFTPRLKSKYSNASKFQTIRTSKSCSEILNEEEINQAMALNGQKKRRASSRSTKNSRTESMVLDEEAVEKLEAHFEEENIPLQDEESQLLLVLAKHKPVIMPFQREPYNWLGHFKSFQLEAKFRIFFRDRMCSEYECGASTGRIKCSSPLYEVLLLVPLVLTSLIFIGCMNDPIKSNFFIYWPSLSCIVLIFSLILTIKIIISKSELLLSPLVIKLKNSHCSFYGYHFYLLISSISLYGIAVSIDTTCAKISHPNLLSHMFLVTALLFSLNFSRSLAWVKSLLAILAVIIFTLWSFFGPETHWGASEITDDTTMSSIYDEQHYLFWALYIANYVIVIIFIQFINYDNQLSIREQFYAVDAENETVRELETARERTALELNNVLPKYITDHFAANNVKNYSEIRPNVAIIFFFVDFFYHYSEDYRSGTEWVRFLNELICDFDDILNHPKYSCVEKIKTISSTYMAASNLNPSSTQGNWKLQAVKLMEFAIEMKKKLYEFCISGFQYGNEKETYKYKVGFNYGDVTSGVIGTCKLHFDIWGDSVNVASRMYSTAEPNKIQLTEKAKDVLQEEKWDSDCFSYRGKVFVKGKGHMDTFYFKEPSSSKGN